MTSGCPYHDSTQQSSLPVISLQNGNGQPTLMAVIRRPYGGSNNMAGSYQYNPGGAPSRMMMMSQVQQYWNRMQTAQGTAAGFGAGSVGNNPVLGYRASSFGMPSGWISIFGRKRL